LDALRWAGVRLDPDGLHAIAGMATRRHSPLRRLELDLRGMGPAACQRLCGCLAGCPGLERLDLTVDEVAGDTLDHVAAAPSLKHLLLEAVWSPEAVTSVLKQLRTSPSVEALLLLGDVDRFGPGSDAVVAQVEETLQSYNFLLHYVGFSSSRTTSMSRIDGYLRRNDRIRNARETLPPLFRAASPLGLWPVVLQLVSDLPSLTYQLLRRGDIRAFCDVLHRTSDTTNRRRSEETFG
jgi:hypothetical protein